MTLGRENAARFVLRMLSEAPAEMSEETRAAVNDPATWIIDHVCYRTETFDEYCDAVRRITSPGHDLHGQVLSEAFVNGRPITTIRMDDPIRVRGKSKHHREK